MLISDWIDFHYFFAYITVRCMCVNQHHVIMMNISMCTVYSFYRPLGNREEDISHGYC